MRWKFRSLAHEELVGRRIDVVAGAGAGTGTGTAAAAIDLNVINVAMISYGRFVGDGK